ncbi:MAG TPA: class I SAM-dependent methyltransferase [Solirubrobacteraceae bacterium]|nr:class I SAM-dependent methyltransferase [Solirubrobacteraceae bacterium]
MSAPDGQIGVGTRVRRSRPLLRAVGVLPKQKFVREELEGDEFERFFEKGERDLEKLLEDIRVHTGVSDALTGRTGLDYGGGMGRIAIPMAERCEHVYCLDVNEQLLASGANNAQRKGLGNVDWLPASVSMVDSLAGRYDAVISTWVLQHIRTREGERVFASLVGGLRPGGVGAINATLGQPHPWLGLARAVVTRNHHHLYQALRHYSLDRMGEIMVDAGITDCYVRWQARRAGEVTTGARGSFPSAMLVFRKPG